MPWFPAFVLMSQAASTGQVEFTLRYRRPSALVAQTRGLGALLTADDARSVVHVQGTPAEIGAARSLIALFDVPRKPILVRLTVNSPLDHLTWEVAARLSGGQRWKTADEETDLSVALEPKVDADGSLTVMVVGRCHGVDLTSKMRMPKGESRTVAFGKQILSTIDVTPGQNPVETQTGASLPTLTVRYVGG